MALQISYTDLMGATHSTAYAKIDTIKFRYTESAADIYISIFHDSNARSKSDAAATKKQLMSIIYVLKDSTYSTYLADSVLLGNSKSVLSQVYTWIKTHNDGSSSHNSDGVRLLNEGNGINWTTATDV